MSNPKNIVIVGAGKGIGLKTAELLSEGNNVFAISRNETDDLSALGTSFYGIDVSKDDLGVLDGLPDQIQGLIYCPGSIVLKPFNRLSEQDFLSDFQQNVMGAVRLIQKLLPAMKRANGASVVLFSTVAVKLGMPFHASIAASKGAVEGLAKSLAAELAISAIRVNVIAPSLTETPLAANLLSTPEKKDAAAKRHPLQRVGTPEEMAQMAAFLVGDNSAWITGQVIGVDGGLGSLRV